VSECSAILRAEDVYTGLLRDNRARAKPGAYGSLDWSPPGRSEPQSIAWELRSNAVWRFGRLFLTCPWCGRRATRLYVPREDALPACRRCWGLTYESRQQRNYKDLGAIGPGLTCRVCARTLTYSARLGRAVAAARRYAERRDILRKALRS
jgi:hypothetical protein